MNYKTLLNYVAVILIVAIIIVSSIYIYKNYTRGKSYQINGIEFISDNNAEPILSAFMLNSSVDIVIYINENNKGEDFRVAVLYGQIFSALRKDYNMYIDYYGSKCTLVSNGKDIKEIASSECEAARKSNKAKIVAGFDSFIEGPKAYITPKEIRLYSKDSKSYYSDNRNLLKTIITNIDEIEQSIQDFISGLDMTKYVTK